MAESMLVLGIDTCGPSGSVALGRLAGNLLEVRGQKELAGRTYSATLVTAVGTLLADSGVALKDVGAIVTVNGPGSFTGVRVGLSAVKGLAEPTRIPVVAVSRLAVLAANGGCVAAALDAHRGEVFLRMAGRDGETIELLARGIELVSMRPPGHIAVCDEAAASLLANAWPGVTLLHVPAPTAADALHLTVAQVGHGDFVDVALLDGHYLRRSDAEIFGEQAVARSKRI